MKGNGQDILLKNNNDYIYMGEIELTIGQSSTFTVLIENIAGMLTTKTFQVIFRK